MGGSGRGAPPNHRGRGGAPRDVTGAACPVGAGGGSPRSLREGPMSDVRCPVFGVRPDPHGAGASPPPGGVPRCQGADPLPRPWGFCFTHRLLLRAGGCWAGVGCPARATLWHSHGTLCSSLCPRSIPCPRLPVPPAVEVQLGLRAVPEGRWGRAGPQPISSEPPVLGCSAGGSSSKGNRGWPKGMQV